MPIMVMCHSTRWHIHPGQLTNLVGVFGINNDNDDVGNEQMYAQCGMPNATTEIMFIIPLVFKCHSAYKNGPRSQTTISTILLH